jgi:hypothetical protein
MEVLYIRFGYMELLPAMRMRALLCRAFAAVVNDTRVDPSRHGGVIV